MKHTIREIISSEDESLYLEYCKCLFSNCNGKLKIINIWSDRGSKIIRYKCMKCGEIGVLNIN